MMKNKTGNGCLFLLLLICLHLSACLFCLCNGEYCNKVVEEGRTNDDEDDGNGGIKGMFVFGSSLVDNGNNNYLQNSTAKADYLPYGIDFPHGPSGRFTNGKNVIDLLGELLRLPSLLPAFTDPSTKGCKVVHGVDFASAASGILDETGFVSRQVITLNQQTKNFEEVTLPELEEQMGCTRKELLPNYLFVVGTGGNDYSFNYFLRKSDNNVSLQAFTANLTNSLSLQLKKLYSLGARKFVLMSINPLGCYPMVKALSEGRCIKALNQAATLFNNGLKTLIDVSKTEMPSSNLVFVNSYKIISDIIKNPVSKGFRDADNPCCEVMPSALLGGGGVLCKKDGKVCGDRSVHVFFDGLHPTEAVNMKIATKAFTSYLRTEVYPINVNQLAEL